MQWYLSALKKYAVLRGRARRKEYWMFSLFNFLVACIIGVVCVFSTSPEVGVSVLCIYLLLVAFPGFAVTVRRLHDIDRSGWWILISCIPVVGPFILLYFSFCAGTTGENRFGEDPKAI